jgi:hypothetical protein
VLDSAQSGIFADNTDGPRVWRRALFLWQWSEIRQGGVFTLVKINHSGGCQIVIPITLFTQNGKLFATVVGTGTLGVENGLLLLSRQFDVAGSTDVELGPANQGVYAFNFVLNSDSANLLAILDSGGGLTVLRNANLGSGGPLPSPGVLEKFWSNLTSDLLKAALAGALGDWIKSNAVGAPLLVVVGFVSGGTAFAVMALSKGPGTITSPRGCDTTFAAGTLCFGNVAIQHPILEGGDGIALGQEENLWVSVNERNAIAFVSKGGKVTEVFRDPPNAAGLRNSADTAAGNRHILEFPTVRLSPAVYSVPPIQIWIGATTHPPQQARSMAQLCSVRSRVWINLWQSQVCRYQCVKAIDAFIAN